MRGKIKVVISVLMVMTIIFGMIGCGGVSTCTVTVAGGTGGGTVDVGSSVTVTADEIEEGKAFAGWTDGDGKVLSTENPYTFKAGKDITLTATVKDRELVPLEDTVYYTVVVDGGIVIDADGSTQFEKGEEITVSAVPPEFTEFDYWSVDGESYSTQEDFAHVVMGNIKFTAAFTSLSRFELSLIGCTSESEYIGGIEYVTVTANELDNYKFTGWKVNNLPVAETDKTYEFALEEDTVVEALFKRTNISVTATSTQPDLVSVTVTGDTDGVFEEGDTVTVSAVTKNGITVTWRDTEGGLLSRNNPYVFTATDDIELEAHFNAVYTVTVIGGLVNGKTSEVFGSGGEARVEAAIADGDMFVSWTNEDGSEIISTANPYVFFVSSNVVLKAHTKEINENEKTFIFEAENADLSQCSNAGGAGGNTFGTDSNINYGSTISNPEDYKPSNNSWAGNFNNRAGNKITWTITSDSDSTAVFVIRMSNGVWNSNDSSKNMDIAPSKLKMIMNGTAIDYTPFMIEARNLAGTGASSNAALKMFIDYTISLELPIQKGENSFVLELVTTGSGPNVDCLKFTTAANLSWVAPNTAGAPLPDYDWYLGNEPDEEPDDESEFGADYNTPDLRFYDTFDNYTSGWQITQDGTFTSVAQNDSSVTVTMNQAEKYGFITRKSFVAPTGAFTYSFRTKINSSLTADRSVAEFSVRSSPYLIRVVLTYDKANPSQGHVQDDYGSSAKQYDLDVTEWHDYQVVVGESYSYDLYVDGTLAWSGAAKKGGGGDMIKIGADSSGTIPTSGVAHFDLDYFKMERGERASAVRVLTGKFVDGQGKKLTALDDGIEDISAVLMLENTFGANQTVTLKMELIENAKVVRTVTENVLVRNGEIKEATLTMDGISGDPENLKIKVTLSVSAVKISGGMILAPAEDEEIDDRNTFIFEAENADLSQCGKVDGTGTNTYGSNASINYGSSISNPEDYKPSNNSWAGNFNNKAGNKITWTIASDSASTAKFVIRMSNGVWNSNQSSKNMDIISSKLKMIMNGTAIDYTPFIIEAKDLSGTGAADNAALMMFIDYTISLDLPIVEGVNTFVLELVTTGSGPNVDCLKFTTDANLSWVAPNTAIAPLPNYPWYL